jgi:hypothetical protein
LLITLYESDGVHFKPNSKEFLSRKAAVIQAKNVAKKFNASNCDHLTVHGFAASGVDQDTYESKKTKIDNDNAKLTLARAKAFGQLLRTNGFSGEISYEGDGTCEGDQWTENGLLDEALQKLCRRVEVSN